MQKKLFEIEVTYTDGTDEMLLLDGNDYKEAELEAESWVDFKKTVKEIKTLSEVCRRKIRIM